ncbi:protein of unknown function [Methylotuvimicrobium alcaliphilum 20Z]|uniref:Uncharacterized protein n=1 Tax=Methylotuvimicrobium alcaliphilum (strain DSM 19304 / NCIMB 14124 / VKM B-2133 / 20Z) TaxID=1091494 RepID=G4STQ2_META2|nr:protein of unknown function [Methylotuvimicrobium alcaliphilum 20Z]
MDGLTYRPRLFHSPFDRLRANGKILKLMGVTALLGTHTLVAEARSLSIPTLERWERGTFLPSGKKESKRPTLFRAHS